jgi:hypothetical protein
MQTMMLDELIVLVLLLVFVSVVTGIRLKARAQRAKNISAPASAARKPVWRGERTLEATS